MSLDSRFKDEALRQLMVEVSACKKCGLWRSRRNPVLGDGDPSSPIVFIGEAPGYWEDVRGKPFVGAAGRLLDEILGKAMMPRNSVYITNVVKCRPPENRDPLPEEIEACSPYLDRQLDLIRPRVIVTLGRHSTAYIFSRASIPFDGISRVQGKVYEVSFWGERTYVVASYHPAAALYNVRLRGEIENTIKLAGVILGQVLSKS
ncbi:MAG: uracil-DNA glycosylase family protein [Candidatus Bathyarchaeia archaeon]|nr:uracil-DNA glycosylase [Candidatus Bathyarchaeota archaeon]